MSYHSTRGQAPALAFDDVLLAGLARDGGLYLPEAWPRFSEADLAGLAGLSYQQVAVRVMQPFLDGSIAEDDFAALVAETYAGFDHAAVAPLTQLGRNDWLLELFHGPTLAFKDYALQLLGRLFDHVLTKKGRRVTIVGATSGDTGSAAIEACRDRAAVDIVILHPKGRTSEVQRRQMTTVTSANVRNIAIEGTFDDCQDMVKAMFNDQPFRDQLNLSAVNSINWARIMAQIVYYFAAGTALGAPHRPISFAVPTGNFGNVYAAFAARRMGLPIRQLVVGSNSNDILTRFFESGVMSKNKVVPTLSPSMDIQVSSNFERYLFDLFGEDAARVVDFMERFRRDGRFEVGETMLANINSLFQGYRLDDEATSGVIRKLYEETGELLDPHTAIGVAAGRARRRDASTPMVALATAHAAKFPDAVEAATGIRPALPSRLGDLFERPERYDVLPNDLETVKDYVRQVARVNA
ncbi:threonine synthase [Telmatospirillum siberiense]|uniref:Threonine synthase n=1 Tax=Telmatospirillum siberiense TaxID=382514 RepID=A0A2N3PUB9_9PROT|nr:threonine synthase [Telmatospirillum siberiense]PKU23987.1 threonine synthase [Telmatospirillum siberiense]